MFNPINSLELSKYDQYQCYPSNQLYDASPFTQPGLPGSKTELGQSILEVASRHFGPSHSFPANETHSSYPDLSHREIVREGESSLESSPNIFLPKKRKKKSTISTSRNENASKKKQIRCGKWTTEEDELLTSAVEKSGKFKGKKNITWKQIAKSVPNRDDLQCMNRWKNHLASDRTLGGWKPDEDELLIMKVKEIGNKWKLVAKALPSLRRSAKQCRERWVNNLDPNLNHGPYFREELKKLSELVKKSERSSQGFIPWASIEPQFNFGLPSGCGKHRSQNSLKNTYNSRLKKLTEEVFSSTVGMTSKKKRKKTPSGSTQKNPPKRQEISLATSSASSSSASSSSASHSFNTTSVSSMSSEPVVLTPELSDLPKTPSPFAQHSSMSPKPLLVSASYPSSTASIASHSLNTTSVSSMSSEPVFLIPELSDLPQIPSPITRQSSMPPEPLSEERPDSQSFLTGLPEYSQLPHVLAQIPEHQADNSMSYRPPSVAQLTVSLTGGSLSSSQVDMLTPSPVTVEQLDKWF